MFDLQRMFLTIPGLLLAITVHEYAHGFIAYRFGDPTAKTMGRLTFNPIAHLDPIGAIMLLLAGFGWAKPVPVNFFNLRNPKRDMVFVALAGPLTNIITAFLCTIVLKIMFLLQYELLAPIYGMLLFAIIINIALAIFNIIPVPPLDGSKILLGLLPYPYSEKFARIEPFGFIILIVLIFSGMIGYILWPAINFVRYLFGV